MTREPSIWTVLGIEPTNDQDALRRAYLRKLRVTNPEDDAAAFQQLRKAYETARDMAAYQLAAVDDGEPEPDAQAPRRDTAQAAPPPEPPADPQIRAVHEQLEELSRELQSGAPPDLDRTEALLAQLLGGDNLQRMDVIQVLDQRLADELGNAIPRSDHLLKIAATAFQWPERRDESSLPPMAHAVLSRLAQLSQLHELEVSDSEQGKAWRRLRGSAVPLERWIHAHVMHHTAWPELELLDVIDRGHPELLAHLNEKNVDWWRRFAQRPRISLFQTLTWLVLSMFAGLAISAQGQVDGHHTSWIAWTARFFGVFALLSLVRVYLIEWPIIHVMRRWGDEVPLWVCAGWVVDCLSLPLLGLVSRSVPWLAWSFAAFAVLTALWAAVVGGPTGPVFNKNGDGLNATNSRLLRIVFRNTIVGSWTAAVVGALYPELGLPLVITLGASLAASALGRHQQFVGFAAWQPVGKLWGLAWAALALTAAMMCVALVYGHLPEWQPGILVGTVCLVILRRCFAPAITFAQGSANAIWIWMMLVVLMFVSAMVSGDTRDLKDSFANNWFISFGALLLLASAMLSLVRFLWQHRPGNRQPVTEP